MFDHLDGPISALEGHIQEQHFTMCLLFRNNYYLFLEKL